MTDIDILVAMAASKVKTRKLAKALSADDLKKLIENLSAAYESEQKREAAKQAKKKAAALKKLQTMMVESGLSPADVAKLSGAAPKKRGRKAKAKAKAAGADVSNKLLKKKVNTLCMNNGKCIKFNLGTCKVPAAECNWAHDCAICGGAACAAYWHDM